MRVFLCVLTGSCWLAFMCFEWIIASAAGVTRAIRDAESRVLFTGYNTLWYKLSIWTFSAVMCGIAGAVRRRSASSTRARCRPPRASRSRSGRRLAVARTLIGPIIGAFFVNGAKSYFTVAFPGILAVLSGRDVHRRNAVPAAGNRRSDPQTGRQRRREMTPDLHGRRQPPPRGIPRGESGTYSADGSGGQARSAAWLATRSTPRTAASLRDDITVSFDGFRALNKLTLNIAVGELRCIIGPNGAGKTTMMDVITGKTKPDSGRAFFGSNIDLLRLRERDRGPRHRPQVQKPTVSSSSRCSRISTRARWTAAYGRRSCTGCRTHDHDRIAEMLKLIHLRDSGARIAGDLSHGRSNGSRSACC